MKKFFISSSIILLLDQLTKFLFTNQHFGIINYAENTGAAFSILQNQTFLLILIPIITCIILFTIAKKDKKLEIPLSFIFAGALSNLIDRVFFGYVRDFIDLKVWPIFNIADSFNVIGVLIIIYLLINKKV